MAAVRPAQAIADDLRKAIPDHPHLAALLEESARRMAIAAAAETFLDTAALLERGHVLANRLPPASRDTSKPANLPVSQNTAEPQHASDSPPRTDGPPPYWLRDNRDGEP